MEAYCKKYLELGVASGGGFAEKQKVFGKNLRSNFDEFEKSW